MQLDPVTPNISNQEIEARANALLDRYGAELEPIIKPPVPVEKIADLLLELNLYWAPIEDTDEEPIMAYIDASKRMIKLNEVRKATHFDRYPGLLTYSYAHELGHHELHMLIAGIEQLEFPSEFFGGQPNTDEHEEGARHTRQFVCRTRINGQKEKRERQADQFASYLLLPERLLLPASRGINLLSWSNLYRLRDQFAVSISALVNRLGDLGLVYAGPNKTLHRTKEAANGQRSLF